jgi:hypothetical protein
LIRAASKTVFRFSLSFQVLAQPLSNQARNWPHQQALPGEAAMSVDAAAVAVPMPASVAPLVALKMEASEPDPRAEGTRAARGILLMIGVEAVAALVVYGVWQAVHLIR